MKKLFTLFCAILFGIEINAQLLVEDFNYTTTDLATNGWSVHSGTTDPIATTTGLTYAGYANSGIGNAANVIGAGMDYNQGLASTINTNGATVYTSLLVRFTETGTTALTGGYFFHLGNRTSPTSFTTFCARLWAKMDASGVINIGVTNSSTAAYSASNYSLNTTYLIIIKYTINTAGNDEILAWIKSSGVPTSEAAAGPPDITLTTEAGLDIINAVAIRQTTNIPDVVVDGIRVADGWYNAPMPATLKYFSASLLGTNASINWSTANEVNVNGYEVEKSNNGINYTSIGFTNAKNTNTASYSLTDVNINGLSYYRLKTIDKDGKSSYSKVVTLNTKKSPKLEIFPNPVVNNLTVSHEKATGNAVIKIATVDGKIIMTKNLQEGATQSTIDVSKLLKGNYLVLVVNDGNANSTQFIKQ